MSEFSRKDLFAILLLAGLAVASCLPRLQGPIDLRWDGGAYYVLGTSLAQGKGYRLLNEPGEIQSTLHAPMLPVLVAVHQMVLQTSDPMIVGWWLRLFYFFLFVIYAVAIYVLLRAFLAPGYATLATLVCLSHFYTVFASNICFPEIPFSLATVLFAWLNLKSSGKLRQLTSAPLAVIAFALRTVGVAMFAAWVLESVVQRRFRQAGLRMLLALIPVFGWAGYITYVEASREYQNPVYEYQRADYAYINVSYTRNMSYKDPFSPELGPATWQDKATRFLDNLKAMPFNVGEAVSTRESLWDLFRTEFNDRTGHTLIPEWAVRLILLLLTALIALGVWQLLANKHYYIPLYIFFFLLVLCATPWPSQFTRYLTPLAPFLSLALFLALKTVTERLSQRLSSGTRFMSLGLTVAVTLSILASQAATLSLVFTKWNQKVAFDIGERERFEYHLFFYHDLFRATDAGLDWLKSHGKSGDVLAATDPQWAYLRIGMKTVLPPFETDADKAQHLLDTVPVKYLIVDESRYKKYTTRVVADNPDCWRRVYSDSIVEEDGVPGKFEIYERVSPQ